MLRRLRISLFFLLALTVLSGTVRAGNRYFFCTMMGVRADACCVRRADHAPDRPTIDQRKHACCESRVVEALPASTLENTAHVSPPSLASTDRFCDVNGAPTRSESSLLPPSVHPPDLPHLRQRSMVFLI
jgi:hypothetical protein